MKCSLIIALLTSNLFCFSQKAELKGVFFDSLLYSRPVRIILLKDTNIISETGIYVSNGKYSFKNLYDGLYTLRFLRIGERPIVKDSIVIKNEETVELNVHPEKECHFHYPKGYKPHCPKNPLDKFIPIVYGFPSPKMFKKAKAGKIRLGGCIVTDCDPHYYCPKHDLEF